MNESENRTEFSALKHPVFWVALAVLLLNDHVFKGGDVLPAWLTGKLSDFAGLIVAPIVLVALLRARTDRRRALAMFIVGGWFVGANLFVPVAEATTALAAQIGLSWRFWVDSTDLVALAVLPLTWQIIRRARPLSRARLAERLALGFGVAACVASPPPEPTWNTDAFVVNDTDATIDLRVRWVESAVDCASVSDRYAEALPRDTFGPGTVFRVLPRATLPLDRGAAEGMGRGAPRPWETPDAGPASSTPLTHRGDCDVVMISADGLPETIVFWQNLTPHVIPDIVESSEDERDVADGLQLRREGDDGPLRLDNGLGYTQAAPIEVYDGGATCRDYGTITGFDWSELPAWRGERVRITAVRPTIDGCVEVSFDDTRGLSTWEAFICVPPEDFTFLPNSEVQVWNRLDELRIVRDLVLDDGSTWRTAELVVSRDAPSFREGPFALRLTEVDGSCGGMRMSCGGFRVPAAGGLTMGGMTRFVHPGDIVERDAEDGRRARLRVGRAETMWVTHAACGAGRDQLGPRLEALVVYGEEPR